MPFLIVTKFFGYTSVNTDKSGSGLEHGTGQYTGVTSCLCTKFVPRERHRSRQWHKGKNKEAKTRHSWSTVLVQSGITLYRKRATALAHLWQSIYTFYAQLFLLHNFRQPTHVEFKQPSLWIKNAQNNNLNLKEFEVLNGEKLTKTRRSEMNFISWHFAYVDMRDMMVIKLFLVKIWLLWY